jgi:hypothetical protein
MKKQRIFPLILLLLGLAFVLGALFSWFDNLTATDPVGLGKWIFDVLQFLFGLAGTWTGLWLTTKKRKPDGSGETQRLQEAIRSPDSEQTMDGKAGVQKQKSVDSPRSKQSMK